MMNVLDQVAELLNKSGVPYSRTDNSITVRSQRLEGFDVQIFIEEKGFSIHLDGWHEEFSSEDEAVSCFRFGLSAECRLEVTYRGPLPTRWVLQYKDGEHWTSESTTALLIPPFWRKRIVYKHNGPLAV